MPMTKDEDGHDTLIIGVSIVAGLLVVILMALTRCGPAVHPPTGPNTDYPCGLRGLSCGSHMCCWLGDTCNDGHCAPGMCCAEGVDQFASKRPYTQMLDVDVTSGKIAR